MSQVIKVRYFAGLRELAGVSAEDVETKAATPRELYQELSAKYGFKLKEDLLKVSLNREYQPFDSLLKSGDELVFIPPVSGG